MESGILRLWQGLQRTNSAGHSEVQTWGMLGKIMTLIIVKPFAIDTKKCRNPFSARNHPDFRKDDNQWGGLSSICHKRAPEILSSHQSTMGYVYWTQSSNEKKSYSDRLQMYLEPLYPILIMPRFDTKSWLWISLVPPLKGSIDWVVMVCAFNASAWEVETGISL